MMLGKRGLELVIRFVKTLRVVILAGREVTETSKMRISLGPWKLDKPDKCKRPRIYSLNVLIKMV